MMSALLIALQALFAGQPVMLVSEYGSGNVRGFTQTCYQMALADAEVTLIPPPATAQRYDGLRRCPDDRFYVLEGASSPGIRPVRAGACS